MWFYVLMAVTYQYENSRWLLLMGIYLEDDCELLLSKEPTVITQKVLYVEELNVTWHPKFLKLWLNLCELIRHVKS